MDIVVIVVPSDEKAFYYVLQVRADSGPTADSCDPHSLERAQGMTGCTDCNAANIYHKRIAVQR